MRSRRENRDLDEADLFHNGVLHLYRNERNRPFGPEDQYVFSEAWSTPDDLPRALARATRAERARAAQTPFAWDARFGYLSPIPEHCGTGVYVQADMHLEGLHLIGDLPPVQSALAALRMDMQGLTFDGIRDAGHFYRIGNKQALGLSDADLVNRVGRIFRDLAEQERNARLVLVDEHPLVFDDSVSRALAILKSARLLSRWELFDLLSPIRLAASSGFIQGLSVEEVDRMMMAQTCAVADAPPQTPDEERKRDLRDASLARQINRRFARVVFRYTANT